jgi:hypothetical protein
MYLLLARARDKNSRGCDPGNFVQSNFVVAGRDDLEHQLEIVEHRKKGC